MLTHARKVRILVSTQLDQIYQNNYISIRFHLTLRISIKYHLQCYAPLCAKDESKGMQHVYPSLCWLSAWKSFN